jgi:hypothetical protein
MNIVIDINTDNDAFHSEWHAPMRTELMHLVESAVDHYMATHRSMSECDKWEGKLQDGNGNTCGSVTTIGNKAGTLKWGPPTLS